MRFAAVSPHRRVAALRTSPEARYDDYFQVQNAIVGAYRPLKCQPRVSDVVEPADGADADMRKGGARP